MSHISEHLNSSHKRSDFSCGKEMLDVYLHKQALQDVKRKLSTCFVVIEADNRLIKGYYTLSNSSIPSQWIPEILRDKLPKSYLAIPATLIGRLAIDKKFHQQGLGKLILIDALKRCYELSKIIGSFAIVVDPIDLDAESFYEKFGFIKLPDSEKMFLPMKTISQLFE